MGEFRGEIMIQALPQADRKSWRVHEPLTYRTDAGECITVLAGATTDGASIPRLFWRVAPPLAYPQVTAAALIHDQLYATQGYCGAYDRAECDGIFLEAMQTAGVNSVLARSMWLAVRIGGGAAWRRRTWQDVQRDAQYLKVQRCA